MKKYKSTSISPTYISFSEETINGEWTKEEHMIIFPTFDDYRNTCAKINWENQFNPAKKPKNFRIDLYNKI